MSTNKRSAYTIGATHILINCKLTRLIVIDIGWSPVISVCDCHLIHDNDIAQLSTAATKYLHWSLFCKKILSENFRTKFPRTFCNVDEFSLGPIFHRTGSGWNSHFYNSGNIKTLPSEFLSPQSGLVQEGILEVQFPESTSLCLFSFELLVWMMLAMTLNYYYYSFGVHPSQQL